jgi:hypothetical protein
VKPLGSKVTARARSRDDRAGDPLDGLVNLFDIGIVLSVAFLLAALSSLDLTSALTEPLDQPATVPDNSVIVNPQDDVRQIELEPGQEVVGRGEPVGTLYRLEDGSTVIVRPGATGPTGATGATGTPGTPDNGSP